MTAEHGEPSSPHSARPAGSSPLEYRRAMNASLAAFLTQFERQVRAAEVAQPGQQVVRVEHGRLIF